MSRKRSIPRDEVRRLHGEGYTDRRIAAALDCSRTGVISVRRELGLEPHNVENRFTPAELEKLRELSMTDLSYHQIGLRMGRAESSCRVKLTELAIRDQIEEDGEGELRRKPNGMPYLHYPEDDR